MIKKQQQFPDENSLAERHWNFYQEVQRIVHISTSVGTGCQHCQFSIGLDNFAESINHYIEQHGYKLLHVGAETSHDIDGKPWHGTIAVLGK